MTGRFNATYDFVEVSAHDIYDEKTWTGWVDIRNLEFVKPSTGQSATWRDVEELQHLLHAQGNELEWDGDPTIFEIQGTRDGGLALITKTPGDQSDAQRYLAAGDLEKHAEIEAKSENHRVTYPLVVRWDKPKRIRDGSVPVIDFRSKWGHSSGWIPASICPELVEHIRAEQAEEAK